MAQYAASAAQQAAAGHQSLSPLSPSASVSASVGTAPPLTPSGTAPAGTAAAAGPAPSAATAQSGAGSSSASQPQDKPRSQSQSGAGPSAAGGGASSAAGTQHKRVYQACIPCRRRKVRCDLGSVDNPSDPPCVRCRRESKECYFSATRRKRKVDDDMTDIFDDPDHDDYILRNGRKQLRSGESPVMAAPLDRRLYSDVPLTPGGSRGRAQPLRRPGDGGPNSTTSTGGARSTTGGEFGAGEANTPLENLEARTVMRREVYGPHDALDLLYKAATDKLVDTRSDRSQRLPYADVARLRSPMHRQDGESTAAGGSSRTNHHAGRPGLNSRHSSHHNDRPGYHSRHASRQEAPTESIDPELTKRDISQEPGYNEALKAWARFRFVRAGWFTAQEAIDYIEYYYAYLSPLTPISPPTFRNPASHLTLLTEEPILTVTLLTIASRYRRMPGTGGHCRSHAIHEQLWTYLRGMIERVVWGQEAFGGGFCGSGADESQSSSTAPWRGLRRGSLRTFGTIESLMILTEWHPRALHFPPSEAIDELLLPSYEHNSADDDNNQKPSAGIGGRRIESWLEPAWRSDRMCWMLLSTALGLAYELGVFDDIDELLATGSITRPEYEDESYRLRAHRIKRLLLIYLSQLAGRLNWTNMVPENMRNDPIMSRRRPHSGEGTTPGTNPSSTSNGFVYIPDLELDDQIILCWAGVSNVMHRGNEKLFRSRNYTTDIIQSGKYIQLLKEFQPLLRNWWNDFNRFVLPPYIRHILTIEYEYVRIYVNSLALQAVVERCTNNPNVGGGGSANGGSVSGHSAPQLSPQTQNYLGKLPLSQLGGFGAEDEEYVKEVVNGSRNLLRTVVDGLLPKGYLKHAPVRTYFRIISGAMFLLKTFALGAPKSDVELSISLMDQTVDALRHCVVDDVHLGIRFADMLETLTSRLRNRFIHAPPPPVATTDGRSPNPNHQADTTNGNGPMPHGAPNLSSGDVWSKLSANNLERANPTNNISATPWDVAAGDFPYPTGSASMFGPSTPAATSNLPDTNGNSNGNGSGGGGGGGLTDSMFENTDWANPSNEMWYLPTGPAFFQNIDNTSVSMTAEGVNVGGVDLLDFMAMDPMDGASFVLDGGRYP
ncbi:uncharacterized protein B0T23DRAFT_124447 [Neurospora hispaniola]|uniref:Zn(2)-C6 fungal-type domain-containing protein n=1 Tax=Neurospora hispaniola TaxID=588809 RepID=A0AAJ0IAR1_9PEZI|nr:hypothetical protein B0T23DRAFT_124447 [Neurospora hispaniola]